MLTDGLGRVPLEPILQKIENMGIFDFATEDNSNLQISYYSEQARIFVNAPNPAKAFIRVKEDIGVASTRNGSSGD